MTSSEHAGVGDEQRLFHADFRRQFSHALRDVEAKNQAGPRLVVECGKSFFGAGGHASVVSDDGGPFHVHLEISIARRL